MGEDGSSAPQKVAELASLPATSASLSRNESSRNGGSAKGVRIEHLDIVPVATSARAHLVAVTVDARRVFLYLDLKRRALKYVFSKPSEGLVGASGAAGRGSLRAAGGGWAGGVRPVAAGHSLSCAYASGTFLLAERATMDGSLSQLLAALPNPAGVRAIPDF